MKRLLQLLALLFAFCAAISSFALNPAVLIGGNPPAASYSPTPDILWWKGNTGSGTTDTADAGPNLTLSSASVWGTTFTPGGSSNDFVLATTYYGSSAASVNPAANVMTVEFRLYQANFSTASTQFYLCTHTNVTGSAGRWKIYNDTDGNSGKIFIWWSDGAANNVLYSIARPSTSTWHHMAFVMNNSVDTPLIAYVDGSSVGVTAEYIQWASSGNFINSTVYLGCDDANANLSPCSMKDVRIWAGARTAGNILTDATNYP